MRPAAVADGDELLGVGAHHRRGHRHRAAVGEHELGPGVAEDLDDAEQVVPAAGVERRRRGCPARAASPPSRTPPGWSRSASWRGSSRPGGRAPARRGRTPAPTAAPRGGPPSWAGRSTGRCRGRAAPARCGTGRGPASTRAPTVGSPSTSRCRSGRCQPRGRGTIVGRSPSSRSRYSLPSGAGERQRPADGVLQHHLPADDVAPVRGVGVLEVGQPDVRAAVERVDRHLRLGRAGDLHAAVDQPRRGRRHLPGARRGPRRSPAGSRSVRAAAISARRVARAASSASRCAPNRVCRSATNASASGVRISSPRSTAGPSTRTSATAAPSRSRLGWHPLTVAAPRRLQRRARRPGRPRRCAPATPPRGSPPSSSPAGPTRTPTPWSPAPRRSPAALPWDEVADRAGRPSADRRPGRRARRPRPRPRGGSRARWPTPTPRRGPRWSTATAPTRSASTTSS